MEFQLGEQLTRSTGIARMLLDICKEQSASFIPFPVREIFGDFQFDDEHDAFMLFAYICHNAEKLEIVDESQLSDHPHRVQMLIQNDILQILKKNIVPIAELSEKEKIVLAYYKYINYQCDLVSDFCDVMIEIAITTQNRENNIGAAKFLAAGIYASNYLLGICTKEEFLEAFDNITDTIEPTTEDDKVPMLLIAILVAARYYGLDIGVDIDDSVNNTFAVIGIPRSEEMIPVDDMVTLMKENGNFANVYYLCKKYMIINSFHGLQSCITSFRFFNMCVPLFANSLGGCVGELRSPKPLASP